MLQAVLELTLQRLDLVDQAPAIDDSHPVREETRHGVEQIGVGRFSRREVDDIDTRLISREFMMARQPDDRCREHAVGGIHILADDEEVDITTTLDRKIEEYGLRKDEA